MADSGAATILLYSASGVDLMNSLTLTMHLERRFDELINYAHTRRVRIGHFPYPQQILSGYLCPLALCHASTMHREPVD